MLHPAVPSRVRPRPGAAELEEPEPAERSRDASASEHGSRQATRGHPFGAQIGATRTLLALQRSAGNAAVAGAVRHVAQRRQNGDDYAIRGGRYTEPERRHAAEQPAGLILTASVIGKLERRLTARAPMDLEVGKKWMRFGSGRLGTFVLDYNDFATYFNEVLAAIGRLQDLLSAGAPAWPVNMSARQRQALRPTSNRPEDAARKGLFRDWREAQLRYATDEGGVLGGLVRERTDAHREFIESRVEYWEAVEALQRALDQARSSAKGKPEYDAMDLTFKDALELAKGPKGWIKFGVTKVGEARARRKEYDKKMAEFARLMGSATAEVKARFRAVRAVEEAYWRRMAHLQEAEQTMGEARVEARQRAALLGQANARPGERRDPALAEVRMPLLVADAWRALAVIGPHARQKLTRTTAGRDIVEEAMFDDKSWQWDRTYLTDIGRIRLALKRADSWDDTLTDETVRTWQDVSDLWQNELVRFNV